MSTGNDRILWFQERIFGFETGLIYLRLVLNSLCIKGMWQHTQSKGNVVFELSFGRVSEAYDAGQYRVSG